MSNGNIIGDSNIESIIKQYNFNTTELISQYRIFTETKKAFQILKIGIRNSDSTFNSGINKNKEIVIEISYFNRINSTGIYFNLKLKNESGEYLLVTTSNNTDYQVVLGFNTVKVIIPEGFFNEGIFSLDLMVINFKDFIYQDLENISEILVFQLVNTPLKLGEWSGREVGFFQPKFIWK